MAPEPINDQTGTVARTKAMFLRLFEQLPELEERYWVFQNRNHMMLPLLFMDELEGLTQDVWQELVSPAGRFADPRDLLARILAQVEELAASAEGLWEDEVADYFAMLLPDAPCADYLWAHMGPASRRWCETNLPPRSS